MAKPGALGANLAELAEHLIKHGPVKTQATKKRVRVIQNGSYILDTTDAVLVWEHQYYPHYYARTSLLKNCTLHDKKEVKRDGKVYAAVVELKVPGENGLSASHTDRVLRFAEEDALGPLAGLVRLEFGSMDQWLEEDSPVFVHPKDPFKRIDILPSERPIEIKVGGKLVAKSASAMHLYETGLPTRYYLPLAAVDQSVLRPSKTITQCPYKGDAQYYNVVIDGKEHKDIVWYYRLPTHESAQIAGLVCFYNEKVDVFLDGKQEEKPKSPFS